MQVGVDCRCGRGGQELAQVVQGRGFDGFYRAEALEQRLLPGLADAGDAVQLAPVGALLVLLPLEGDGEAVHLLLDAADHGEDVGRLLDAQLTALHGDQRPGAVAVVLHHAQDGDGYPRRPLRRQGGVNVAQAAVDQQQVGQGWEFLVAFVGEPPLQHLLHGGVVVGARQGLDGELPIVPLQRLAVHEHHHGGHHVVAAQIGNVVALHPPGHGGQLRQRL